MPKKITTSHYVAVKEVTGFWYELHLNSESPILIDRGLFQEAETSQMAQVLNR